MTIRTRRWSAAVFGALLVGALSCCSGGDSQKESPPDAIYVNGSRLIKLSSCQFVMVWTALTSSSYATTPP